MNVEKSSAYFVTMEEAVVAAAIPDQQNGESIGDFQDNKMK